MKEGNNIRFNELNKYDDNNYSSKVREIGKQKFKFVFKRNSKKGFVFFMTNIYINTLCSIGSLTTMAWGFI